MSEQFKHYLIIAVLLIAALACYTVSFQMGTFALLIVGALLELASWYKLFRGKPAKT